MRTSKGVKEGLMAVALAVITLSVVASSALAQERSTAKVSIAGVVRDTIGRALAGAEARSGDRFMLTTDSGTFMLTDLMPDTVELTVRRIGYKLVATTFVIKPGYQITVAVRMTPSSVRLGTVVVEGQRMDARLWQAGFYERRRLGMGTFFTPDYLAHFGGTISGLLAQVPSVTVERDRQNRATATGPFGNGHCRMNVFIDGALARWAPDVGLDGILARDDILGVEVYPRPAFVPSVLVGSTTSSARGQTMTDQGQRADCGAIFIWTKPFEPRPSQPE